MENEPRTEAWTCRTSIWPFHAVLLAKGTAQVPERDKGRHCEDEKSRAQAECWCLAIRWTCKRHEPMLRRVQRHNYLKKIARNLRSRFTWRCVWGRGAARKRSPRSWASRWVSYNLHREGLGPALASASASALASALALALAWPPC